MEKKVYIRPAVGIYDIHMSDGILISGSKGNGEKLFNENSEGTSSSSYQGQDTKSSGSWNVWSSDDE